MTSPAILIVEDDKRLAHIFALTLQTMGATITKIEDGQEALDYLEHNCPDLMVLDLNLPHASGIDILHAIRANPQMDNMPIILATADDRMGESLRSEVDLLLLKPVSPEQLRILANRLLARKKSS